MGAFDAGFVKTTGGPIQYYNEYTLTTLYVPLAFGGNCNEITITNDTSEANIQASWDGATLATEVRAGETARLKVPSKSAIYIKANAGGEKCRIWAW